MKSVGKFTVCFLFSKKQWIWTSKVLEVWSLYMKCNDELLMGMSLLQTPVYRPPLKPRSINSTDVVTYTHKGMRFNHFCIGITLPCSFWNSLPTKMSPGSRTCKQNAKLGSETRFYHFTEPLSRTEGSVTRAVLGHMLCWGYACIQCEI